MLPFLSDSNRAQLPIDEKCQVFERSIAEGRARFVAVAGDQSRHGMPPRLVVDQQYALAYDHIPFDLGVAPETFRLTSAIRAGRLSRWRTGYRRSRRRRLRRTARSQRPLRGALRERGWIEGRNIVIEYHWAIIDDEQV